MELEVALGFLQVEAAEHRAQFHRNLGYYRPEEQEFGVVKDQVKYSMLEIAEATQENLG